MATFQMKSKAMFVFLLTLVALTLALTTVSALSENCSEVFCIDDVEINGISYGKDFPTNSFDFIDSIGEITSGTVPVVVKFHAIDDNDGVKEAYTDVRVKVYIEGFKEDIEDETSRFHVLEGNLYVKRFTLKLPSSMDLDDLTEEELALLVRISARDQESVEIELPLEVQTDLYSLSILSIDRNEIVNAGDTLAVDVVVENNGFDRLDNVYVRASIPALGVSNRIYVGDLESHQDIDDDSINDARDRRIYLNIPRNAAPGNYEMLIEASSYDAEVKETARVVVRGADTRVLPPVTAKSVSPGDETTFDVVLVNSNDRMLVYTIMPDQTQGFFVEATEPIVAVGADSSKTTKVKVRASESVPEGTYVIAVNANSDAGNTEKVSFTVNVKKAVTTTSGDKPVIVAGKPNTVVVLTVILVIIFVVLLIILIVLLTKKPTETEEFGETNYY